MPSQVKQNAIDIRDYINQKLGAWTDPNPEKDQDTIDDLDDTELEILLAQEQEKANRPRRGIGAI